MKKLSEIVERAKGVNKKFTVAGAEDSEVLLACEAAKKEGIGQPVLIGSKEKIETLSKELNINIEDYEIIDEAEEVQKCKKAVIEVKEGRASFVMKGLVPTATLLKAVLDSEYGIRGEGLLSHVMVYEIPNYHKLLLLTDGGMNISPTLEEKVQILRNAIKVAKAIEIENPKVACLSAVEVVNPKMPSTVEAAKLKEMNQRGEIEGIVDGPLAFDLAISKEAAIHKGVKSEVAGDADILLVPFIEVGNALGKSFTYFAKARSAGIVVGAKAPIVLVSRADSHEDKFNSIAFACAVSV
ncbi:bifunctional enoyl-CoA hydratase/phosphate acetyltransferase [Thermoanaerobacter brockii subsp. lactiethylicus]|uniref:Phosphate butyryltransferase n=2 Tax=Thermoanaerobacter TaxID=1754 RepID=B0KD37_THEP3|nr:MULTISPECIES: bifunctional enoyl-CoA hydratase/phosphate acetyltransferase [Thermoanaerobacter]ABY92246.1 Phosphate butyryltransferase [Thermoanaerobacter sp. X514]ABY94135.1 Phosphate butyryltransferase [Thermoanaerobacter pseudethanolicus ATCC 33223]ADV79088.1 Phosphate butyryltransferase [Thermoanaerobacter brockii subsp. finnii Ako-1]HBW60211.1 phosphate butyryltransferase [Thermoanaerobacter sp.]